MQLLSHVLLKNVKLGHFVAYLHEKVRVTEPLHPCAALAIIVYLIDMPEIFFVCVLDSVVGSIKSSV